MFNSDQCINVADFRRLAARKLPAPVFAFVEGGAEDEVTYQRNLAGFGNYALTPASLVDVGTVDASTTIMGQRLAWPFVVGPTGMPGMLHPGGEIAIARAAADCGALYTLSTMATRSIEEVAAAVQSPKLFQLYVFRDRGITRELVQRARSAGYVGLMLTVDIQVPANRERDRRAGMVIPPKLTARTLVAMARKPRWCWNSLRHPMKLANFSGERANPGVPLLQFISEQYDPGVTWADLEWLAAEWGGPLAVKGILSSADAVRAVEYGASTVILSNHGGRQLDAAATAMDVLEPTLAALDGRGEVIVDGGIRRGTDMVKAIALGAGACMSGRIGLYGLAGAGEAGARRAFRLLRTEFERDMALIGAPRLADITRDKVLYVAR